LIDSLQGIAPYCQQLKVLYLAHNKIKDINELDKLKGLNNLNNVVFLGNDFYDKFAT
jgi:Leucine-rich repeat (LRR) protein